MFAALAGVDRIVHAGDFDTDDVFVMLDALAPVIGVRGNMDTSGFVATLPDRAEEHLGGVDVVVQHRPFGVVADVPDSTESVLIHGHTHEPAATHEGSRLVLNPGAVFAPRGGYGPSLVRLTIRSGAVEYDFVEV